MGDERAAEGLLIEAFEYAGALAPRLAACAIALAILSPTAEIAIARADYLSSEQWFSRKGEEDHVVLQGMLVLLGHYTGYVDAEFGQLGASKLRTIAARRSHPATR